MFGKRRFIEIDVNVKNVQTFFQTTQMYLKEAKVKKYNKRKNGSSAVGIRTHNLWIHMPGRYPLATEDC